MGSVQSYCKAKGLIFQSLLVGKQLIYPVNSRFLADVEISSAIRRLNVEGCLC